MCNSLFLASNIPLAEVEWNASTPGLTVSELAPGEQGVREWLAHPHVYQLGTHQGCGCPFTFEPGWDAPTPEDMQEFQENRTNFNQLRAYLAEALKAGAKMTLYNADEFWLPPLEHRELTLALLGSERFVFDERQLFDLTV